MAIDPSISLAVRPVQMPLPNIQSPVDQLGQVLSLRNLMQQGQSGALELQTRQLNLDQLRRQMQEQQDYADAMRAYAQGGSTATAPAGAAPVQTPIVPAPPVGLTGGPESVPGLPNVGALPSPPPGAPLGGLMTPATAPAATAPASPVMGAQGLSRLGGMNAAQFIARFPLTGLSRVKEAFALDQAEAEAGIKQHDANMGKADELGRIGISIRDSKDPSTQFVSGVMEAVGKNLLPADVGRQMVADGYDKHKNDIDAFIVKAQNAKDYSETQKNNLAAGLDDRKQFAQDMGAVNSQADYTKVLAVHPKMAAVFGDTFSPQVKEAAVNLATAPGERFQQSREKLAQDAQLLTDRSQIPGLITQQPGEVQPYLQKLYDSGLPLDQFKQYAALAAMKPKAGETITKPAPVVAQEIATEKAKELAKADPFGLFAGAAGDTTAGAPTAGAPAAGGTPTPLAQAIANFEGFNKADSVAQRNNNPGNLRAGPGQTGTDKNGYAIFPDVNTGWAALHDLIQKRSADNLTLQEFFGGKKGVYPGYAPTADRNDPANYAATVARQLNVDPSTKLSDIPGSQVPAAAKRITPDMQGQAVLDALPGPFAQMVKGYAEGRLSFPTGRALTSPFMQQMLGLVGQYDPSFDTVNPGKRAATAKAFAVGKEGQQVNALNTAIGHIDDLSKSADKLDNSSWPAYNTVANLISKQIGRSVVTNFDTTKKAVVDELTRVWRGTGGSEQDIKSWAASLDAANSPDQLHGAIATIGRLLESKLGALEDQYREGMGTVSQGRHMITPEARKTLDKLEQKAGGTPAATKSGPAVGTVEDGYRFKGGDASKPENWVKQ